MKKQDEKVNEGVPASQSLAVGLFAVSPPGHTNPPVAEDAATIPHAIDDVPRARAVDLSVIVQQLVNAMHDELTEAKACGKPCHGFQYAKDALLLAEQNGFKPQ